MQFCQKCGSVLVEKDKKYRCVRCHSAAKGKIKIESSEKIKQAEKVGVIKDKDTDVFPTVTAVCSKCGHREAYFWSAQTRSADEAETKFYRCTKCKNTWREYR
jgi:DNA-directed RNA polymerase subunit M